MAAGNSLNPRLDMVWKPSMNEWQPAGQIDGLFDRRSGPPGPNKPLAPPAVPRRQPPPRDSLAEFDKGAPWPGVHRWVFLLVSLVLPFAWKFALTALTPLLVKQFGAGLMGTILPAAAFVPAAVLVFLGLERLLNLGMSRWWCLAGLVPILNLWVGYRCFACPAGYARHKRMDRQGIALTILYPLTVLAVLDVVFFGTSHGLQILEQLRAAIRR
jgi:hypothetical protein